MKEAVLASRLLQIQNTSSTYNTTSQLPSVASPAVDYPGAVWANRAGKMNGRRAAPPDMTYVNLNREHGRGGRRVGERAACEWVAGQAGGKCWSLSGWRKAPLPLPYAKSAQHRRALQARAVILKKAVLAGIQIHAPTNNRGYHSTPGAPGPPRTKRGQ